MSTVGKVFMSFLVSHVLFEFEPLEKSIMICAVTWGLFGAGYYPTGSMRCIAMYGIFTGLGTCPVWVCFVVLLPQPVLLNESRRTTEADGIACGIMGRLGKGYDDGCGRKPVPCGGVPTLPSGHFSKFCLVVIQACAGLPIKYGLTVNPEGFFKPRGLSLPSFILVLSSFFISLSSQHPAAHSALFLLF